MAVDFGTLGDFDGSSKQDQRPVSSSMLTAIAAAKAAAAAAAAAIAAAIAVVWAVVLLMPFVLLSAKSSSSLAQHPEP